MKRFNLLAALATVLFFAAGCESTRSTTDYSVADSYTTSNMAIVTAPDGTQQAFLTRYPGATNVRWYNYNSAVVPIDWELTDWQVLSPNDYVVYYDMNNNNYYSWYDTNGNWIGTTYAVTDYNSLPSSVNSLIATRYPGYTITKVHNEYWKDRSAYQVELKNGETKVKLLVDANGNILKEKTRM